MNKTVKTILIIVAVILSVILLAASYFTYFARYRIETIDTSISPGGEYELLFQSVGEPDFPFGSAHAQLTLKKNDKTISEYEFDIANDGKIPDTENWEVNWKSDSVSIHISGEEQEQEIYIFELKEDSHGINSVF